MACNNKYFSMFIINPNKEWIWKNILSEKFVHWKGNDMTVGFHIWSVLQYSGDIMKSMKFLKYSLTFDNSRDSNKSDLLFEYKER